MRKIILYTLLLCSFYNMNAQDLNAIWPINYPKIETEVQEDESVYFKEFDITLSKDKEISYDGKLIYKCEFTEYYEYLLEVFASDRNYILVSPLAKSDYGGGVSTPYNVDRGIVLLFDLSKDKKYYLSLDKVKRIIAPKAFEFAKNKSHVFMIKDIDVDRKELVLLQGGVEIKEVIIKLFEF